MQKHPIIQIYTKPTCPYCIKAKQLLETKHVVFQEINIEHHPELKREMELRSGRHTVPQIFIGQHHVGGCDDLYELDAAGGLDKLLATAISIEKKE